jgi:small nuclear ribonucleoprotein (snRNP)-like protein
VVFGFAMCTPPFLPNSPEFRLNVWLCWRCWALTGVLAGLDGFMNIAMEQTEEYVNGQLKNKYGDCFIRGNNGVFSRCCFCLVLVFMCAHRLSVVSYYQYYTLARTVDGYNRDAHSPGDVVLCGRYEMECNRFAELGSQCFP